MLPIKAKLLAHLKEIEGEVSRMAEARNNGNPDEDEDTRMLDCEQDRIDTLKAIQALEPKPSIIIFSSKGTLGSNQVFVRDMDNLHQVQAIVTHINKLLDDGGASGYSIDYIEQI